MLLCVYLKGNPGTEAEAPMASIDPYSHIRLHELRQEQLERKASRRRALKLDDEPFPGFRDAAAGILRALAERVASTSTAERQPPPSAPARPEAG
jgi:hypothetical protein